MQTKPSLFHSLFASCKRLLRRLFRGKEKTKDERAPLLYPYQLDDVTIPRSKPKQSGDVYIPRRLIIAGSYYCDKELLDRVKAGTYFELHLEQDNPYDKDAVRLAVGRGKIGYVAIRDKAPYVGYLKQGRTVYGVVTEVIREAGKTCYEYETWLSSSV